MRVRQMLRPFSRPHARPPAQEPGRGLRRDFQGSAPSGDDSRPWLPRNLPMVLLIVAIVAGSLLRLGPVLAADFPLHDGGLFFLMVQELKQADYALPWQTSYNGADIPFAYPPLGFYLAAALSDLLGRPILDIVRVLPAVLSALSIPAFYMLSRALSASPLQGALATVAFALLPRTFKWFVMGGGLTRAPGFLFALLALYCGYLLYTRARPRDAAGTALFSSLTVLSHAETTWFVIYSLGLMHLWFGRTWTSVRQSVWVVLGVLLLTSPWWVVEVMRHGVGPFAAAAQSGGSRWFTLWPLKTFYFTEEPLLPIFAVLGLLGLFRALATGAFFLPVWMLSVFVLQPRAATTWASVPFALLIAMALDEVVLPALRGGVLVRRDRGAADSTDGMLRVRRLATTMMSVVFLAYVFGYGALATWRMTHWDPLMRPLGTGERDALQWVREHTSPDSTFAVVTGQSFPVDRVSEWFPVLTGRVSRATVQGQEWLPDRRFLRQWDSFDTLQNCENDTAECLDRWSRQQDTSYTHVYVRRACCQALLHSLEESQDFKTIYRGAEGDVFVRQPALAARGPVPEAGEAHQAK